MSPADTYAAGESAVYLIRTCRLTLHRLLPSIPRPNTEAAIAKRSDLRHMAAKVAGALVTKSSAGTASEDPKTTSAEPLSKGVRSKKVRFDTSPRARLRA